MITLISFDEKQNRIHILNYFNHQLKLINNELHYYKCICVTEINPFNLMYF